MWHAAARMSTPRSFIGLGLVGSSSLYAIGGYDGEDYLEVCTSTVEVRKDYTIVFVQRRCDCMR
eukprot:28725-Eustigmatos_ZCMA.PRE.1